MAEDKWSNKSIEGQKKNIQEIKVQRINIGDLLKHHQGQREHRISFEGLSNIKNNQLWEKKKKRLQKEEMSSLENVAKPSEFYECSLRKYFLQKLSKKFGSSSSNS